MTRIIYDDVSAMRPEYIEDIGDCTEVIYENRETYIVEQNIKSVLRTMAHYYNTDLKANRINYGEVLNIVNNVPIVFSDKHILVPFKARKPLNKRDGAYGYVNLYKYADCGKLDKTNYILLNNSIKLKLNQRLRPFKKRLSLAVQLINERR
ncbi:MAG: competence protein ComK [Eubacteriales bacterium]|nr:competence protein ComK [Eubacteriales bacterium]